MSTELTPVQRLAISRSQLAQAMRQPVWWMLLQRLLQDPPKP